MNCNITLLDEHDERPDDGDVAVCSRCGVLFIFDSAYQNGSRFPTAQEAEQILRDGNFASALFAWVDLTVAWVDLTDEGRYN